MNEDFLKYVIGWLFFIGLYLIPYATFSALKKVTDKRSGWHITTSNFIFTFSSFIFALHFALSWFFRDLFNYDRPEFSVAESFGIIFPTIPEMFIVPGVFSLLGFIVMFLGYFISKRTN
jgi:cell division protein FtsX